MPEMHAAPTDPSQDLSDDELIEKGRSAGGRFAVLPGKPAKFWSSFQRLLALLLPYRFAVTASIFFGAIAVFLSVLAPKVLGHATNLIFEGFISRSLPAGTTQEQVIAELEASDRPEMATMVEAMTLTPGVGIDFSALGKTLLIVLLLYLLAALLTWAGSYILNRVIIRTMYVLREQVENKIHRLPLSYFDRVQRGELLSRVTNDIDNITNTMQQQLSGAVNQVLTVIGVIAMMFSISWRLALVALCVLPLMALIFGVVGPKSQAAFKTQWKKTGLLNSRVEESFSGHTLVHAFGRSEDMKTAFARENEDLYQASFKAQFYSGIFMPAISFIGSISYVAIAVLGSVMVTGGTLRLGDIQAFIQYSQQFTQPLGQLGSMVASVQSAVASAERLFDLLDASDEAPDPEIASPPQEGTGAIVFDNVSFSYSPDTELIRHLSFSVAPGQTVAIVGPTGAGKTTLVNLIMRFYDLDDGRITFNGQDISSLRRRDVRARTGMVLQDPWLFQGSIMENIRYGRHDATDSEVIAAAQAAFVDDFVHSLPEGYNTELEEDASNVSSGQRQLITIARAFVADPSVLILDEATSSVDTRTELLVQKAMAALRRGRTSFVIAHRLSTIRDADFILVMEDGAIVEKGTHHHLLEAGGAYARLYAAQFSEASVDIDNPHHTG